MSFHFSNLLLNLNPAVSAAASPDDTQNPPDADAPTHAALPPEAPDAWRPANGWRLRSEKFRIDLGVRLGVPLDPQDSSLLTGAKAGVDLNYALYITPKESYELFTSQHSSSNCSSPA